MDTPNDTLTCTKCGNEYPATAEYFKPDKKKRNGFFSWCRACCNEDNKVQYHKKLEQNRQRALDYRNAHLEQSRETTREYHRTHKDRERETNKAWRERHPEYNGYNKELSRKRYRDNREQILAADKLRRRNNPLPTQIASFRRKSRHKGLPLQFTVSDWRRALDYFEHRCAVCGRQADMWTFLARDHWIPITNTACPGTIPTNIVPLCHAKAGTPTGTPCCNQSKFNHHPMEWLIDRFGSRRANEIARRIEQYFASIS